MDQTELQNAFDSLKRLHEAQNSTVRHMQDEIFSLKQQLQVFKAGNAQHTESQTTQNNIIQQTLDAKNSEISQLNSRIQELKEENRALKNG